uniref:Uncharacterized protein n=2 Tax=Anguilla anguilla TaxID=7936 RepID=A0A0E9SEF4_ANGAN
MQITGFKTPQSQRGMNWDTEFHPCRLPLGQRGE